MSWSLMERDRVIAHYSAVRLVVSARGLCRNTKGTSLVKCLYARSLGMKTTPCVDWDLTEPCCRMQMHLSVLIVPLVPGLNLDQSLSHLSHASHLWVLPS